MAAVPSIGRASSVETRPAAPEAELTRELYERHGRQIFAYCLHQLGSREEAEDATQTTFMNAFRGLRRGVVPELESAWLFKIANNVILTRRRSSSRRRRVETPGDLDAMQDVLASRERDADELIRLSEALGDMPEQQRRALLLREWQGLSYREIGEELSLSQAAVETLLFRARRSLARGLTDPEARSGRLRKRVRNGLDAGGLLGALQSLLGGGAAVKAAATAAVVAGSVVATQPVLHHAGPQPKQQAPAPTVSVARPAAAAGLPSGSAVSVRRVAAPARARTSTAAAVAAGRAVPKRHVPRTHVPRRAAAPRAVAPPVVEPPAVERPSPEPAATAPPAVVPAAAGRPAGATTHAQVKTQPHPPAARRHASPPGRSAEPKAHPRDHALVPAAASVHRGRPADAADHRPSPAAAEAHAAAGRDAAEPKAPPAPRKIDALPAADPAHGPAAREPAPADAAAAPADAAPAQPAAAKDRGHGDGAAKAAAAGD